MLLIILCISLASSINSISVTPEMCVYCFDCLQKIFNKDYNVITPHFTNDSYPIFVTWKKEGDLRGCIGTFDPQPLQLAFKQYTYSSSQRDSRFPPVQAWEVPDLDVHLSILHSFELCSSWDDWEIGKHGIRVMYYDPSVNRMYQATYLPEVMIEQRWNKYEAISSVLRKGGFRGKITDQVRKNIQVTRYQSARGAMTYDQYLKWKGKKMN